jgi:hypothetical protein
VSSQKSVTLAFDRLIDEGLTFGDLTILSNFWLDKVLFVWLPRPPLFLGPCGISFFTSISMVDVMSAQSGLDHYFSLNSFFHCAYK